MVGSLPVFEPAQDCDLCPRLAAFRKEQRRLHPNWHNAPVPGFGPLTARLLIVGLAPGLRGANRTGRPFTGDWAGDLLYETLIEFGFATGLYAQKPDDGLTLQDCRIVNAVRCVPPENKPTGSEITACRPFLKADFTAMPNVRALLCLGVVSHNSVLRMFGRTQSSTRFAHGARHLLPGEVRLYNSYHCSRYNTNTGRLTADMFKAVFANIRRYLDNEGEDGHFFP